MKISANGIALEIEDHGSPQGEPLLLIMGLGMQLVAWHEDFVESLVQRGFRVIRFDNRDIGLSENFDRFGAPKLGLDMLRFALGMRVSSPYTLADMAADSVGILDALGIPKAHICGASMGGMIAQQIAVRHPDRVKSLTLMMTSTGARKLPGPSMKVRGAMLGAAEGSDQCRVGHCALCRAVPIDRQPRLSASRRLCAQPPATLRAAFVRPAGTARQMVAIAADGDRSPLVAQIRVPAQIIHGAADPLVPLAAGRDLAAKIPDAELDVIEGMGHDLPVALWPRFVAGIATAAGRA